MKRVVLTALLWVALWPAAPALADSHVIWDEIGCHPTDLCSQPDRGAPPAGWPRTLPATGTSEWLSLAGATLVLTGMWLRKKGATA